MFNIYISNNQLTDASWENLLNSLILTEKQILELDLRKFDLLNNYFYTTVVYCFEKWTVVFSQTRLLTGDHLLTALKEFRIGSFLDNAFTNRTVMVKWVLKNYFDKHTSSYGLFLSNWQSLRDIWNLNLAIASNNFK